MSKTHAQVKADKLLRKAKSAAAVFSQLDQEHTDRIVKAVYEAGLKNRIKLAKMAESETGIGRWEDKVIKNVAATLFVYEDIKDLKTVGVISDNRETGIMEIAQPIGPVLGVIPAINPTSTTLFKILIALKTRNPIILSLHQEAIECCIETAKICYEAALSEDAPEGCIQWNQDEPIDLATFDIKDYVTGAQALMEHNDLALIIASGGNDIIKHDYDVELPILKGSSLGNMPVLIDKTADVPFAVEQILLSKTFDNGSMCASEQAAIADISVARKVIEEFKKQGGYFLSKEEIKAVEKVAFSSKKEIMNANILGKSVAHIADLAGIEVPEGTKLLIASLDSVGKDHPLSSVILCPILAFYVAEDIEDALKTCIHVNFYGGIGYTASIYSNDEDMIKRFSTELSAARILVNTPSSQGGIGSIYNKLHTSLTLECGTYDKNITIDNITAKHLIKIQCVAKRRVNERLMNFNKIQKDGKSLFYDETISISELLENFNRNY